jgi:hypothetical protein
VHWRKGGEVSLPAVGNGGMEEGGGGAGKRDGSVFIGMLTPVTMW